MPKVGGFTVYPNATIAALQLGLLAAGWLRFRASARPS